VRYVCPECGSSREQEGACADDGTALAPAANDALLGETIGHWRIARLVGAGGMGRVYAAVQPEIGARVAIKVLKRESLDDTSMIERFFNEARAVNLIKHEAIVDVIDLARLPDGSPYIVMEYLDGAPLAAIFKRAGRIALGTLARIVGDVLGALAAAHAKGIVHRDLKPDNVFISPSGRVTVLDFGIAKLVREDRSSSTRTGALLGTPAYMSPEQARSQPLDARTDLYAAGVMLYEGATGALPFVAANLFDLLKLHVEAKPAPPRNRNAEIPAALEAVILRALAKDPADRFASAAEMRAALATAAAGLPATTIDVPDVGDHRNKKSDPFAETAASTQSSLGRGQTLPSQPPASVPPAAGIRLTRKTLAAILGGAAALGIGGATVAALVLRESPPAAPTAVPSTPPMIASPPPQIAAAPSDATDTSPPAPAPPDKEAPPPPSRPPRLAIPNRPGTYPLPLSGLRAFHPLSEYKAMKAIAAEAAGARVEVYSLRFDQLDRGGGLLADGEAEYQFFSRDAARAGRNCIYVVDVKRSGATLEITNFGNEACESTFIGEPSCSFAQLIARAKAPEGASGAIKLTHNAAGEWYVHVGSYYADVEDDCD
jgi:serine/threonine-protein kinase